MKVLVAIYYPDALVWNIPIDHVERLRHRFPHHTFVHVGDDEGIRREIVDAEVAFSSIVRPTLRAQAARLRWIHSSAAGVGSLLDSDLRARGIVLTNSRGVHARAIAEHAVAVTLMLFRKLNVAVRRQLSAEWAQEELSTPEASRSIAGSRVGVVGLGAIGSAVAHAMAALDAEVHAVRRRPELAWPSGVSQVGGPASLPGLLSWADVVVLTAAHTHETKGLIGATELARMKPDAVLVNVSRGRLVDERALVAALERGAIGGAALDVFEQEPLEPQSPMWRLPNVIVTPHSSGFRADYWDAVTDLFSENLQRFERGAPLLNVVDLDLGY